MPIKTLEIPEKGLYVVRKTHMINLAQTTKYCEGFH